MLKLYVCLGVTKMIFCWSRHHICLFNPNPMTFGSNDGYLWCLKMPLLDNNSCLKIMKLIHITKGNQIYFYCKLSLQIVKSLEHLHLTYSFIFNLKIITLKGKQHTACTVNYISLWLWRDQTASVVHKVVLVHFSMSIQFLPALILVESTLDFHLVDWYCGAVLHEQYCGKCLLLHVQALSRNFDDTLLCFFNVQLNFVNLKSGSCHLILLQV